MLSEKVVKSYCKDFTKIENYQKAIEDVTQTWDCHHRLETHNSDGERRLVDLTLAELIALDMYYDRPSEEFIFLSRVDHRRLHSVGKGLSEETKAKISVAKKGKKLSEEHRAKLSAAHKERKLGSFSEEHRVRMSASHKGKHWKLVDGKRVWY